MGKFRQAIAWSLAASAASLAWSQTEPDLYDSTGRAVGKFKGDSVVLTYDDVSVRVYTDTDWDYAQGRPLSSGLTWKHVPLYYETQDCTGQAYIGVSPTTPAAQGAATTSAGPPYTAPSYGSQYLFAPSKQGTDWTAYISQRNGSRLFS